MFKVSLLVITFTQSSFAFLNGGLGLVVNRQPRVDNGVFGATHRVNSILNSDTQVDIVSSEHSCDVLVLGSGPAARAGK